MQVSADVSARPTPNHRARENVEFVSNTVKAILESAVDRFVQTIDLREARRATPTQP